ncbi:MAG: G2-specific serine/threonine protein kinase [Vezdaea aestivalis]|nr:MAG: G2-specific serine/threonine protein kinase [Vezdaea aestivalis]
MPQYRPHKSPSSTNGPARNGAAGGPRKVSSNQVPGLNLGNNGNGASTDGNVGQLAPGRMPGLALAAPPKSQKLPAGPAPLRDSQISSDRRALLAMFKRAREGPAPDELPDPKKLKKVAVQFDDGPLDGFEDLMADDNLYPKLKLVTGKDLGVKMPDRVKHSIFGWKPGTWKPLRLLGKGGYGIAYLWERTDYDGNGHRFVVTKDERERPNMVSHIPGWSKSREAQVLAIVSKLNCSSILKLLQYMRIRRQLVHRYYLEYCPYGDLTDLDSRYRAGAHPYSLSSHIPEAFIWSAMYDLSRAIEALENGTGSGWTPEQWVPILHLDIKTANILLGALPPADRPGIHVYPELKLADFGLAHRAPRNMSVATSRQYYSLGTMGYRGPEQLQTSTQKIGPKLNVFGIGLALYQLARFSIPKQHRGPKYEDIYSSDLRNLLNLCQDPDVDTRPTAAELLDIARQAMTSYKEAVVKGWNNQRSDLFPTLQHPNDMYKLIYSPVEAAMVLPPPKAPPNVLPPRPDPVPRKYGPGIPPPVFGPWVPTPAPAQVPAPPAAQIPPPPPSPQLKTQAQFDVTASETARIRALFDALERNRRAFHSPRKRRHRSPKRRRLGEELMRIVDEDERERSTIRLPQQPPRQNPTPGSDDKMELN